MTVSTFAFEAIIANQLPHYRAIVLLHVALVVCAIGPSAGNGDLLGLTVGEQIVGDTLAATIRIHALDGKRDQLASPGEALNDLIAATVEQRLALDLARCHIGAYTCTQEASRVVLTTMRDEICLKEARQTLIPVGKGTHGDLAFEQRAGLGG